MMHDSDRSVTPLLDGAGNNIVENENRSQNDISTSLDSSLDSLKLRQEHVDHLRSEGFSDENIKVIVESWGARSITEDEARDMGIVTEDDNGNAASSPGLYFPFTQTFGQLRCDNPPIRDRKPAKYLNQARCGSEAFLPEGCEVITEGFKDAAAGTLIGGIPTGALAGVSHYRKALKPGSKYVVLFDADGWNNPQVFEQLFKAGLYLRGKIQLVPEIPNEPKGGLCEYFKARHTADDYCELICSALRPNEFLLELPKHWSNLPEAKREECKKKLLKLAALHLSQDEIDELLIDGLSLDEKQAKAQRTKLWRIVAQEVRALRSKQEIDEILNLSGSMVWSWIEKDDPIFADYLKLIRKFGSRLRFNALKKQVELDREAIAVGSARSDLSIKHGFKAATKTDFPDVLLNVAKGNEFSPVVEYLEQVHRQHKDTSILKGLAERYFGQSEPIYNRMLVRTLIGAVARAYEPGCKVDTALILQGKQGAGKSTFFKILAGGAEYFDDSLGSVSDKDEKLKLHRVWFVEWAELETVFKRKDIAATKAFLSSSVDHVRPPYGRDIEEMRRCSVIVGTTNQDEFLSDATGARRFWIIPVLKPIDLELLRAERDRIWAAAVAMYKAGEQWWLTSKEEGEAAKIAEVFQSSDPWFEVVTRYIETLEVVTVPEILEHGIGIEPGRHDKSVQMRVSDILAQAGWTKKSKRIDGKLKKAWFKPVTTVTTCYHLNQEGGNSIKSNEIKDSIDAVTTVTTSNTKKDFFSDLSGSEKNAKNSKSFGQIGGNGGNTSQKADSVRVSGVTTPKKQVVTGSDEVVTPDDDQPSLNCRIMQQFYANKDATEKPKFKEGDEVLYDGKNLEMMQACLFKMTVRRYEDGKAVCWNAEQKQEFAFAESELRRYEIKGISPKKSQK